MSDGERSSELDRSSDHLEAAAEDAEGGPERKKMKLDPDQSKGSESDDPLAKLLESPGSDKTRYLSSILEVNIEFDFEQFQ